MSSLSLKKLEIVKIDLNYDPIRLLEYYNTLEHKDINDIRITHKHEWVKRNKTTFDGDKIGDLKKFDRNRNRPQHVRRDFVSECNKDETVIKDICEQIREKISNVEFGTITFFLQKAGEDIPLHGDWPYRKNSLLIVPIFTPPFKLTNAITYYKDGGEYIIDQPAVMDVMSTHGVKNIDKDRLMLHIEIPNLTIEEVNDRIGI
tara:strand:- start:268 stop:876 length:609 start_codon:yes stop_codon:yes gene_type:complete